jgi:hypothetical protein
MLNLAWLLSGESRNDWDNSEEISRFLNWKQIEIDFVEPNLEETEHVASRFPMGISFGRA